MRNYVEALQHVPRLQSLYNLLARIEQENPMYVLVADTPFFICRDGTPYEGNIVNPRYVPSHTLTHEAALKHELEFIAARIEKGECPEEHIAKFEDWAVPQMHNIRQARRAVDRKTVRRLKRLKLLN